MWFIGVEIEQETSAPPPKKNPGSAPGSKTDPMLRAEYIFKILNIRGKLIPLRITPFLYHHGYMYLLTEERVGKLEVKKHEGRVGSEI